MPLLQCKALVNVSVSLPLDIVQSQNGVCQMRMAAAVVSRLPAGVQDLSIGLRFPNVPELAVVVRLPEYRRAPCPHVVTGLRWMLVGEECARLKALRRIHVRLVEETRKWVWREEVSRLVRGAFGSSMRQGVEVLFE